jgi:hypothetical protein
MVRARRRSAGRAVAALCVVGAGAFVAACATSTVTPKQHGATQGPAPSTTGGRSLSAREQRSIAAGFASSADRKDAFGTTWLCRPGLAGDPCAGDLGLTAIGQGGSRKVEPAEAGSGARLHPVDCVYVYPTVSAERGENADLAVQASEIGAAKLQAAQFSRVCNVWAPMYRQVTLSGLTNLAEAASGTRTAFHSILAGFEDYLHHYNDGRPFVLIGHSQGAGMGIKLLEATVDRDAGLRKRLVSAILLGGNVTVPTGRRLGGSFRHIPPCESARETGCVIAYSSFLQPPPSGTFFGKPGQGVSFLSGETRSAGLQVVCTNPASLGGGTGFLLPIFFGGPPGLTTPYVEYPRLYSARCAHSRGITWLAVHVIAASADHRPTVTQDLGPEWGLHVYDVNLSLGNLLGVVSSEIASYDGR